MDVMKPATTAGRPGWQAPRLVGANSGPAAYQPAQPFLDDAGAFGNAQDFGTGVARHQHNTDNHGTDYLAADERADRFG